MRGNTERKKKSRSTSSDDHHDGRLVVEHDNDADDDDDDDDIDKICNYAIQAYPEIQFPKLWHQAPFCDISNPS